MDSRVPEIIYRYGEGRQVLIFCASKKGTEHLAHELSKKLRLSNTTPTANNWKRLQDNKLHSLIQQKIAYHHSGLPPDDREVVEQLFTSGHIRILCSTTTLAHGVNLPAHLVIVKVSLFKMPSEKLKAQY